MESGTDSSKYKISVLTPSFNSVRYLQRAIESVLKQKFKNFEHIIMDGGSKDGTVEILNKFPHLIWQSEADNGQSHAMNKAFEKSSGDIIIYLNADDELEDGLFEHMVNLFDKNPQVDMVVGNLRINNLEVVKINNPTIALGGILAFARYRFPLNPVCYAYRRSLQEKIGPFPIDNHYTMDYWFLLRAYLFGKRIKTEFVCGTFYFDGSNKSADATRGLKHLKIVRDSFVKKYFWNPRVASFILKNLLKKI